MIAIIFYNNIFHVIKYKKKCFADGNGVPNDSLVAVFSAFLIRKCGHIVFDRKCSCNF